MNKNRTVSVEQPMGRIFSAVGRNFLQNLNQKLDHMDIERNYYAILVIENAKGNITQQELASILETDKASVVRIVDYLCEKGYIKRIKNPNDRRKYSLVLTAKAKRETGKIQDAINEITKAAFAGISKSQKKEFLTMLQTIKTNLNAYTLNS